MSEKEVVRFVSSASRAAATFIAERSMKFDACCCAFKRLRTSSRNSALSFAASETKASRLSSGWANASSNNASTFFQRSGSIELIRGELAIKPRFGFVPFAHYGDGCDFHDFRGFVNTQASEEAQLDNSTLPFVEFGKTLQRIVEREQVTILFRGDRHRFVQRDLKCFCVFSDAWSTSSEVDQDASHHLRGNAKEVCAILPAHCFPIDQTYVSFVDQCRCLQQVIGALSTHVTFREAVEFGMDKRRNPGQGGFVAVSPCQQEFSEFVGPWFFHIGPSLQVVQKRREFITYCASITRQSRMKEPRR